MIYRRPPEQEPGRAADDTDADILGGREWDAYDPWLNQTGCLIAIVCAGAVALAIVVGGWLAVTGLGLGH